MVEWKKLGEVCEIKGRIGFRGYTREDQVSKGEGAISLSPSNINYGTLNYESCTYITWSKYEESPEIMANEGDIILCKTASVGKVALIKALPEKATINPQLVLLKNIQVNPQFLFYVLEDSPFQLKIKGLAGIGSVPNVSQAKLASILIPIPSLSEQERIVGILDTFTASIDNIKAQIEQRRKQYEHYRNTLLTFNKDDDSVEWKTLGEVAEIGTGSGNTNEGLTEGLYPFYTRGQEILRKNEYEYDEQAVVTAGDGVGVGKVIHYVEGKYALHQRAYRFCPKKNLNTKFLFYYMKVTFYKYVCGNAVASSVSSLRKPKLQVYPIPIPSLARQQEIVSILDTFEASITNLEAQLEQRQKQYEYYREKLLTFE